MSNVAEIIDLKELMTAEIGESNEDRTLSDQELEDALKGKKNNDDPLELDKLEKKSNLEENENSNELDGDSTTSTTETSTTTEAPAEEVVTVTEENSTPQATDEEIRKSDFYKNTLKTMYGDSIDTVIEEDENGNEVEVSIKDAILTEEYFNQLVAAKQDAIRQEAAEGKISTKGLSKYALDLVEIDRNGGDISKLIQAKEAYTDPLDQLDLDNEQDQATAVYLRMIAAGQDEDTIQRLIASYKQEGVLEEKARLAEQELRAALEAQVEQAKQIAKEEAENRKQLIKSYKKEIRANLDGYQLNDNIKNKIVKLATAQDDAGRFEMDKLYRQHRENPKDAADLALFLLDKEEFINQVTNKATEETKLTSAKKLKIVKTSGSNGSPLADNQRAKSSSSDDIPLDSLT